MPTNEELGELYRQLPLERLLQLQATGDLTGAASAVLEQELRRRGHDATGVEAAAAAEPWRVHPGPFAPLRMPLSQLLFSTRGRIPRSIWWVANIAVSICAMVAFVIGVNLNEGSGSRAGIVLAGFAYLSYIAISVALAAKRWQDMDRSRWLSLLFILPFFGHLITLGYCGFVPGTSGANRHGEDPLSGL